MSEYVKDGTKSKGWKQVSLSKKGKQKDDGAPVTADGMEEEGDEGSEGDEAPDGGELGQFGLQ